MWDDDKQERLDELQRRALDGALADADQRLLDALLFDLEQAEWVALRPALSQLRDEQEKLAHDLGELQTQNAIIAALGERYADLLARAKAQLAGLANERDALRREYERAAH